MAHPQFGEMRNGQPMQQDAEECWSQLVTNLSQRLREPAGRSFVEQFFNIEFVTTYVLSPAHGANPARPTAQTCPAHRTRLAPPTALIRPRPRR